ncbi:MAG TPA: abortive infection system antitoxin AbiGi family protein [Nakamurella sp.]|nr:abortive infection system antitoxin AbiGi family protein [Nakamurella sp.]
MTDDYPLGYLGNPGWTDMSDYLVHMTGHGVVGRANLNSILTSGEIRPGMRTGAARNLVEVPNQETTSFSEIPMGHLDRLVARKGVYGVGFSKQALLAKGAAPVWYLPLGTPVASHFSELVRHAMIGGIDPADSIWKCTPFVDYPGVYSTARYEFEWEREWRMPGLLSFDLSEVAIAFASEGEFWELTRRVSWHYLGDPDGGWYPRFMLDPTWDMETLQEKIDSQPSTWGPPE